MSVEVADLVDPADATSMRDELLRLLKTEGDPR
jgi:hypothetical protein